MEEIIPQSLADEFLFPRNGVFVIVSIAFFVLLFYYFKWSVRHMEEAVSKLGGPPTYPIVGSLLNYIGTQERKQIKENLLKFVMFL